MLINELPDDCLLTVFNYMNDLDDLLNCYKVCKKWSYLIAVRTAKVKYLIGYSQFSFDYVYYHGDEPIDGTCLSTLFPNLIIADLSLQFYGKVKLEDFVALIKNQESLKGLINHPGGYDGSLGKYCDKIEMISCDYFEANHYKEIGFKVKQLHGLEDFKEDAHYFPNLERLNIYHEYASLYPIDCPTLEKLKIVEMLLLPYGGTDTYPGFQLVDSCPNLQSAYLVVVAEHFYVDESPKHKCLQDLVICFDIYHRIDLDVLKRLAIKYPNLKHLSLRDDENKRLNIKDEHIEQLVDNLPNLVLLDARECPGVTQNAADHVENHCKRFGRSIKFYYKDNCRQIESDFPQLSTRKEKISRGFDFMKHCFLKRFEDLPIFLIPIDY